METHDESGDPQADETPVASLLLKWIGGIVAGLIVAVGSYWLVDVISSDDEPRRRGTIDTPERREGVPPGDVATGRLSDIPDDGHVWLAARRKEMLWPIGDQMRHEPSWERRIPAHLPRGKALSLVLFIVGDEGNDVLRSAADRKRSLLTAELGGVEELAVVPTFFVLVEADGPRLYSVLPQARRSGGQPFSYENEGGLVSAQYPDDHRCHRPDRPAGLRLRWEMSGQQSGGWGVAWDGSKAGRFDASRFGLISLTVKGRRGGETFEIGLKDTADQEHRVPSEEASAHEWSELSVPLERFEAVNLSSLENFSIGFTQRHESGEVCIDEIVFEGRFGAGSGG
jgi:hypothetical protein